MKALQMVAASLKWLLKHGLPLLVSVLALVYTQVQRQEISSLTHRLQRIEYRPELRPVGSPNPKGFKFMQSGVTTVGRVNNYYISARLTDTLTLVNKGNATAIVVGRMAGDTVSSSYWLRDILQHRSIPNVTEDELLAGFGRERYRPGDTLRIPIDHTFTQISEANEAVLHYLLLYENEMGELFDSYVWVRVHVPPEQTIVPDRMIREGLVVRYPEPRIEQPYVGTVPYDEADAASIREKLAHARPTTERKGHSAH
jgi:hypothetical protein